MQWQDIETWPNMIELVFNFRTWEGFQLLLGAHVGDWLFAALSLKTCRVSESGKPQSKIESAFFVTVRSERRASRDERPRRVTIGPIPRGALSAVQDAFVSDLWGSFRDPHAVKNVDVKAQTLSRTSGMHCSHISSNLCRLWLLSCGFGFNLGAHLQIGCGF